MNCNCRSESAIAKRKGKDITLQARIKILADRELPVSPAEIQVELTEPDGTKTPLQFSVGQENQIQATYYGKDQRLLGVYRKLTIWYHKGEEGQSAVDFMRPFELTENTTQEDGTQNAVIDLGDSQLQVGLRGSDGHGFTFDDLTPEQKAELKGEPGEPGEPGAPGKDLNFDDLTPEQKAELKGEKGEQGEPGTCVTATYSVDSQGELWCDTHTESTDDVPVHLDEEGELFIEIPDAE